jgi:DNA invertase Pin-like site-specific DNA recombinase
VARQEKAEMVGEFVDKASADDLPGSRDWRRLLELAQARKVDLIVVWRLDRAFRSVLDGAQTLKQLRSESGTKCGRLRGELLAN